MTDNIRKIVKQQIAKKGISDAEFGRQIGVSQPNISRMLKPNGVGQIPKTWQDTLEALELELVVKYSNE